MYPDTEAKLHEEIEAIIDRLPDKLRNAAQDTKDDPP